MPQTKTPSKARRQAAPQPKPAPRMSRPRTPGLGDEYVAQPGRLAGADPFDRLFVTAVHSDGSVDLKAEDGRRWKRVDSDALTHLS